MFTDNRSRVEVKSFTANLAQAAGTYDLCTASGDVLIHPNWLAMYMATAGATFTSVAIQTNQTNPTNILTAGEGAVANLTSQKCVPHNVPTSQGVFLKSGQKLQYVITGATGTGSMEVVIPFTGVTAGATLS